VTEIRVAENFDNYVWRSRFRRCVTNRKVAGSISDGVIGICR